MSERFIAVNEIKLNTISQRDIDDTDADKLCMFEVECFIGWSYANGILKKKLPAPTLADLNRWADEAIKKGGLAKRDATNSQDGYVLNHEINFQIAGGPKGFKKLYEYFKDVGHHKAMNLLLWGACIELRDEGRHSLLAHGVFLENGITFFNVSDPWPLTDDKRFNCSTLFTERNVAKKGEAPRWVKSRSIECFAWYYREGSNPKWV